MNKFRNWLESVEKLDPLIQESLLQEAPHTFFAGPFPQDLAFLDGRIVDLGFENLGLEAQKYKELLRAFSGTGVIVPNSNWRLRFAYPNAVVEPIDGTEKDTLPTWWKQAVLVINNEFIPTWVGKKLRPDQITGFNLQGYRDVGDALVRGN